MIMRFVNITLPQLETMAGAYHVNFSPFFQQF